jgi:hypothetical protein
MNVEICAVGRLPDGDRTAVAMTSHTMDCLAAIDVPEPTEPALDVLLRQALDVPGAASALLQAFAAQSRALHLVQEADARGAASLPSELRHRIADVTRRTPTWLTAVR